MKRKIGFIFLVFLSLFFLFSCGDKNNQIEFTEEYFEKKLVILKKGEIYKIDTEKLFTNKFNFEIEEYSLHLGNNYNAISENDYKPIAGDEIIFEDKKSDFKLYCISEFKDCLDLKDNIITAKDLGKMSVSIIIQLKNGTTKNKSNRICSQILEVVVTDNTYSNFTKINNINDFKKMHNSKDLFILNQSLELNVGTESFEGNLDFFGIFINPYNYSIDLTLDEDHERLFMNLKYAVIDNIKISHLQVFFQRGIRNLDLFSYKVKNSCLSNILIQEIIVQSEDSNQIVFCDSCECSTFSNIEIHTSEQLKTNRFYVFGSIQSSVFIKNLIFLNYSQTIGMCGIAFMVESTVANSTYALPYERKNEDAFEVYNILFINKSSNEKIECGFQYFNVISQYPFGKDKVFYSVGFNATDDLFINKTIEEVTSGESLFTSGEFKFEKGKLPTLFY